MPATEPPYPAAFRQRIIELVAAGKSPAELSREFGCTAQIIANWVGQAAIDRGKPLPGDGLTTLERESFGETMTSELVLGALNMALELPWPRACSPASSAS